MSSSSKLIVVHLARALYLDDSAIEGEVELDFRRLVEDKIEEVHVKLRGLARTVITKGQTTMSQTIELVRDDVSIWSKGGAYPLPGNDTLCIPFRFHLPKNLYPSCQYAKWGQRGRIRYALSAVGVRPGALKFNSRVHVPIALVPKDAQGASLREKIVVATSIGVPLPWRTEIKEEKMRRGLWGDYATAQVELKIPQISSYPLHVPIPFVVKIKTISTPLTRAKADAHPADKPVFPPVPLNYDQVAFKLRHHLRLKARICKEKQTNDVHVFARRPGRDMVVEEEVPARKWIPFEGEERGDADPETKGTWVQEATFKSTFRLDCPPTFAIEIIKLDHFLSLNVPFPGVGNDVLVEVPITVTSGIDAPLLRDQSEEWQSPPPDFMDLPPEYWDATDHDWDDLDKKG
ncbi:hypothetical protein C8Q77DRAFT_1154295 [Trametes polyzona]|nr:hypothetical protein C8Q77DRAFT_1154295 [Trametes polyzona]